MFFWAVALVKVPIGPQTSLIHPQPKGHRGFARVIRVPEIPVGLQQPMALPSIKTTFNYVFLFPPYLMGTMRGGGKKKRSKKWGPSFPRMECLLKGPPKLWKTKYGM